MGKTEYRGNMFCQLILKCQENQRRLLSRTELNIFKKTASLAQRNYSDFTEVPRASQTASQRESESALRGKITVLTKLCIV